MKVAVVGSRKLTGKNIGDLGDFLPEGTTEIISGGVKGGIFAFAREYALSHGIKFTEFLPDRKKYKQNALHQCYIDMINNANFVLALWDGRSHVTKFVNEKCHSMCVSVHSYTVISIP